MTRNRISKQNAGNVTKPTGQTIGKTEFVALMAMMFATIAFSIDSMLPALPQVTQDLGLGSTAQATWVMMVFMIGMGLGTLAAGPLSDAFGRKPLVFAGLTIYALGAVLAYFTQSFEAMLAARLIQGLGAAGPRVVSLAIVRDLYKGREMASIMSLTLMVFLLVPGIAPLMGAALADAFGWRSIFAAYICFGAILMAWFGLRMGETHAPENRRPIGAGHLRAALREVALHPVVRLSVVVQTLVNTLILSVLTMVQPIFDISFGRAETMPLWFGAIAVASGISSLINARLVLRVGMRRLVTLALMAQVIVSGAFVLYLLAGLPGSFAFYVFWQWGVLFQGGLTVANLNAIAMEPMGHIAGMAATVIGAVTTVVAAIVAACAAFLFDGTPLPLISLGLVLSLLGSGLMLRLARIESRIA